MSELLTYSQVSFHPHPGFQSGITDSSSEPQWSYTSDRCSCLLKQSYTGVEFAVILHTAFSTHHTSTLHHQFTATFVAFARCAPLRYTVSRLYPAPSPSLLCCPPACCNSSSVISPCLVYRHRHDICGIGSTEGHQ